MVKGIPFYVSLPVGTSESPEELSDLISGWRSALIFILKAPQETVMCKFCCEPILRPSIQKAVPQTA